MKIGGLVFTPRQPGRAGARRMELYGVNQGHMTPRREGATTGRPRMRMRVT